jgi:hypothetical protein
VGLSAELYATGYPLPLLFIKILITHGLASLYNRKFVIRQGLRVKIVQTKGLAEEEEPVRCRIDFYIQFTGFGETTTPRESPHLARVLYALGVDSVWKGGELWAREGAGNPMSEKRRWGTRIGGLRSPDNTFGFVAEIGVFTVGW